MNNNVTEASGFLVSILENMPYGMMAVDLEGSISLCNKLALDHLGIPLPVKKVKEKQLLEYTHRIPRLHKKITNCLQRGGKVFNLANISVEEKVLNIKGRTMLNGLIITTSDISDSKVMERKMLKAMLTGQEKERIRLSKEIHDGIGPLMSTIKLNIESVKKDLEQASEKTLHKIENMEELVQSVSSDIRAISHALMPSALQDFGVIPALENLALKTNNTHAIRVQLYQTGMEEVRLNTDIELGLFRISQELINNALKYAKAQNITIQIIKSPKRVLLTVEDDGIGFEKDKILDLTNNGIGLRNIKTRTSSLNGIFTIDTTPGKGVTASVEIPLKTKSPKL